MSRLTLVVLLLVALLAPPSKAQSVHADSLARLLPRTSFAFVGSIASRAVPAAPGDAMERRRLVEVRVIEAIRAPRGMALRAGERLQLLVDATDVPKVGTTVIVFAAGWLAGERLSLIEVARFAVRTRAERTRVRTSYDSLQRERARAELQAAVGRADLAALAVVRAVTPLRDTRPPIARSEHDPVWERVSVLPLAVFKGDTTALGRPTAVLVPTNRSHVWTHMPRVTVADTALFVLLAVGADSFFLAIDSTARFILADSVSVRPPADTMLLRPLRTP